MLSLKMRTFCLKIFFFCGFCVMSVDSFHLYVKGNCRKNRANVMISFDCCWCCWWVFKCESGGLTSGFANVLLNFLLFRVFLQFSSWLTKNRWRGKGIEEGGGEGKSRVINYVHFCKFWMNLVQCWFLALIF